MRYMIHSYLLTHPAPANNHDSVMVRPPASESPRPPCRDAELRAPAPTRRAAESFPARPPGCGHRQARAGDGVQPLGPAGFGIAPAPLPAAGPEVAKGGGWRNFPPVVLARQPHFQIVG